MEKPAFGDIKQNLSQKKSRCQKFYTPVKCKNSYKKIQLQNFIVKKDY